MVICMHAIELDHVVRHFHTSRGDVTALDGVSSQIPEGQCVGLLGANGAGKTTLTKICSTLLLPSAGNARIFGHDVESDARAARACSTTVFGGDRGLYTMLDATDNLRYFGALNGVSTRELKARIPGILEEVGLAEAGKRRVETYSKGMKQRLHLAVGMLVRPRLLLLDEPTVGLDPLECARVRERVAAMRGEGTTVVLTSHNLDDVEALADRVIMIADGRFTHDLPLAAFRRLTGVDAVVRVTLVGQEPVEIPVERWSLAALDEIRARLAGQEIESLDVRPTTLEDAFAMAAGERK